MKRTRYLVKHEIGMLEHGHINKLLEDKE